MLVISVVSVIAVANLLGGLWSLAGGCVCGVGADCVCGVGDVIG